MINIDQIQEQIYQLQKCVDTYIKADLEVNERKNKNRLFYTKSDILLSEGQLQRCEQSIIGQLKLNNIQNSELLNK